MKVESGGRSVRREASAAPIRAATTRGRITSRIRFLRGRRPPPRPGDAPRVPWRSRSPARSARPAASTAVGKLACEQQGALRRALLAEHPCRSAGVSPRCERGRLRAQSGLRGVLELLLLRVGRSRLGWRERRGLCAPVLERWLDRVAGLLDRGALLHVARALGIPRRRLRHFLVGRLIQAAPLLAPEQ